MTKSVFIFLVLNGVHKLMERVLSLGTSFIAPGIGRVEARGQFSPRPFEADIEKRRFAN